MGKIEELRVTIDPEMAKLVQQAVESGEYESAEDVVAEALLDWQMDRLAPDEIEELRRLWREGLESGDPVDGPSAMAELRARYEAAAARLKAE